MALGFFGKRKFLALFALLLLLNISAIAFSPISAQGVFAGAGLKELPTAPVKPEELLLQGNSQKASLSQNFVSCSTGWEKTETPDFYFCASKKKYEFCESFELDGKKCNNFNGVKSGGDWVKLDLGGGQYRQVIFSNKAIFEEDQSGKNFVPFYEKHKLSVKDGDFKMQWGKNNNDAEIKLSFGIGGEVYTIAGLKTLDAGIDVKNFAKNLSGGTKVWYEIKNVPQSIRGKLEFIKMFFAPQAGFQKEQIKKIETDTGIETTLPEGLNFDLSDLKENGFDVSFENDYTLIIKPPQGGWGENIVLDPVFQSPSVAEDVSIGTSTTNSMRIFMKFNISSIPAGSTINSAALQMNVAIDADDDDYTFYRLDQNQGWTETNTAAQIWAMHTGVFQSATGCYAATGDQNCAITTVFQAAYNAGDSNFSFRMEDPDTNGSTPTAIDNTTALYTGNFGAEANYKSFSSSEGTTSPVLFVTYALPAAPPDVNVTKIDGWQDNATLPVFGYTRDKNLTIDFNISDPNDDRLTIDINYSTTNTQGSGTALYTDLNLTTSTPANCDDLDFTNTTECSVDFNISGIGDTNWFMLIRVEDGSVSSNDFNASDNSFKIDNNAPTSASISVSSWTALTDFTNDTTPPLTLSASDANGMAFSCNGTSYSSYAAYAASYSSFDIKPADQPVNGCGTTDGNRTLYVKFQDTAGNTATASASSFTLDATNPSLGTPLPSSNTTTTNTTPDLNVLATETNIWHCTATPYVNGAAQADQNVTTTLIGGTKGCFYSHSTALSGNDTIKLQFRMRDRAGNSADLNTSTYTISTNSAPDVNVAKIDSYADSTGLPVFGYTRDGNLTIDFNVSDPNDDRLTIDINYSTANTQGSGTALYTDLNLTTFAPTNCDDLNFADSTECSVDLNISAITDNNYFILIRIEDASLNDFNASDNSFKIDNNAPTAASISADTANWAWHTNYTNDTTPALTISASDANEMAFSCDGTTYSSYVAYAASYGSFNAKTGSGCTNADGNKTIRLKVRDLAGNTSSAASTSPSFVVDATAPAVVSFDPSISASNLDTTPQFSVNFTESNKWYCTVRPFVNGVAQADQNVAIISALELKGMENGAKTSEALFSTASFIGSDELACAYTSPALSVGDTILAQFLIKDKAGNSTDQNTGTYTIGQGATNSGGGQVCGDLVCNGTETCKTCQTDCKTCPAPSLCGNNSCNAGETYYSCPSDCPQPSQTCQELGGTICTQSQECSGGLLNATDSKKCCLGTCFADPDLSVAASSSAVVAVGQMGTVAVTIYNKGGSVGPFDVVLREPIEGSLPQTKSITTAPLDKGEAQGVASLQETTRLVLRQTVNGLSAGNSATITFQVPFDGKWLYTSKDFLVVVDPNNLVKEKDESNNQTTARLYFGGDELCTNQADDNGNGEINENCGVPDLLIKSISEPKRVLRLGQPFTLQYNITIESRYACAKNFKVDVYRDSALGLSTQDPPLSTVVVDELCPGKSKTLQFEYKAEPSRGSGTLIILQQKFLAANNTPNLRVILDSDNFIIETNETNNFARSVVSLPELRATVSAPQSIFYGGEAEINVTIFNEGFADAGEFSAGLFVNTGPASISAKPLQEQKIYSLAQGESTQLVFKINSSEIAGTTPAQSVKFSVAVDYLFEVEEQNELNNAETGVFEIINDQGEIYYYDSILGRSDHYFEEEILVGLWAKKGYDLQNYKFIADGTELPAKIKQIITGLSQADDFVIFEADHSLLPQPAPYSLAVTKDGAQIFSKEFTISGMTLEEIYNKANSTSLLLKISPMHLKRMHYERIKALNTAWWNIWFYGA